MPSSLSRRNQGSSKAEATDTPRDKKFTLHPVPDDDPIFDKWPKIRQMIVTSISLRDICMVTCYRLGIDSDPRSQQTAVVVVYTSRDPPGHLPSSQRIIRDILNGFKLNQVIVQSSHGKLVRGSHSSIGWVDPRVFQQPMLGQSLSRDINHETAGTLGGFFEILLPGESEWKTGAMTCFHCIDQPETGLDEVTRTALRNWRANGILPEDPLRSRLKVCHPSNAAVRKTIVETEEEMSQMEALPRHGLYLAQIQEGEGQHMSRPERTRINQFLGLRKRLQSVQDFEQRRLNDFGCVLAGSGLVTAQVKPTGADNPDSLPSNLDWALIEIPGHRVGVNQVRTFPYPWFSSNVWSYL